MTESRSPRHLSRRSILIGGAGAATIAVARRQGGVAQGLASGAPQGVSPSALSGTQLVASTTPDPDVHLAATDGWVDIARPGATTDPWMQNIAPFWPDPYADAKIPGANLFVFGFRNVTGLSDADVTLQRGLAQITAPQLQFKALPRDAPRDVGYRVKLSNLGLSQRPDLVDGHTIHWHGFVNAIPMFDGVPELSFSVPIGRSFTYFYRPYDPGTYMYHCHFEDVEHVQMGMTGLVFVTPLQDDGPAITWETANGGDGRTYSRFVFDDVDGSTGYDRVFGLFQTEIFAEGHYRDAHIQTTDWTNFKASFWCLNGRTYPDTVFPNAQFMTGTYPDGKTFNRGYDPTMGKVPGAQGANLQYQPQSSLLTANEGERVLLRIANLGYQNHAMTMDSITLTVVGKDASHLRSPQAPTGATVTAADVAKFNQYINTYTVDVGPGESRDVLFTAPKFTGGKGNTNLGYDAYLFYDRDYAYSSNAGRPGAVGGMATQLLVFPAGTLNAQAQANDPALPSTVPGTSVQTIA